MILCFATGSKTEQNNALFNTAKTKKKSLCWNRCFSNTVLSVVDHSVWATMFQQRWNRCFSNTLFWRQDYFRLTVFQQQAQKLVLINNKLTVTKTSSSHREISTGTLQFHKPIFHYIWKLQFQHCCSIQKKKLSLVLYYSVLQKRLSIYIFYTVVSTFYSAGNGHSLSITALTCWWSLC